MLLPRQSGGILSTSDRSVAADQGIVASGVCGTGWNEPWVRDSWGNANFTDACREHDRCYETCGQSKEGCDGEFHNDLKRVCRQSYSSPFHVFQKNACLATADAYHSAVHRVGGDAYRAAQRASGCNRGI